MPHPDPHLPMPSEDRATAARPLSGVRKPLAAAFVMAAVFVVLVTTVIGVFPSVAGDFGPYLTIVAHEAPLGARLSLGSGRDNDLVLTEGGIAEHQGVLVRESGGWRYHHRTATRTAEIQSPRGFGDWTYIEDTPRFAVVPGGRVITGVPTSALAEIGSSHCSGAAVYPGTHSYRIDRLANVHVALRSAGGERTGHLILPLAPAGGALEGLELESVADTPFSVCADGSVRLGACETGLSLPRPLFWFSRWVDVPDDAQARLPGTSSVAWEDTTDEPEGIQFIAIQADAEPPQVQAVSDGEHALPLMSEEGGPVQASVLQRGFKHAPEVVAHPTPGQVVVSCDPVSRFPFGRDPSQPGAWKIRGHGSTLLGQDDLLVLGRSVRYHVSARDPAAGGAAQTEMVQLVPVQRPDGFQLLSSVAAGRAYQPSQARRIPACDWSGIAGTGEPQSFLVVRAAPGPGGATSTEAQAQNVAVHRIDEVSIGEPEGGEPTRAYFDLPVAPWAMAQAGALDAAVPLLDLCASTTGIYSKLVAPPDLASSLLPVLTAGAGRLTREEWSRHSWGDRVSVGGQVIELRSSLPTYERSVPLALLAGLLLVALYRCRTLLNQFEVANDAGAFGSIATFSLLGVAVLMLLGYVVQARLSVDPGLLASGDYLQRTWFSLAVAAWAMPAALAFWTAWAWGDSDRSSQLAGLTDGLTRAMWELGIGLSLIVVAALIDRALWAVFGNPPIGAHVQRRVLAFCLLMGQVAAAFLWIRAAKARELAEAAAWIGKQWRSLFEDLDWQSRLVSPLVELCAGLRKLGAGLAGLVGVLSLNWALWNRVWEPGANRSGWGVLVILAVVAGALRFGPLLVGLHIERLAGRLEVLWPRPALAQVRSTDAAGSASRVDEDLGFGFKAPAHAPLPAEVTAPVAPVAPVVPEAPTLSRGQRVVSWGASTLANAARAHRAWRVHPAMEHLYGEESSELLAVVIVPFLLLVSAALARMMGGAAHNNLEFGMLGLGFKPAELTALVLGLTLASILHRNWARQGASDRSRMLGGLEDGRGLLARWADPRRVLDGLRTPWFWWVAALVFAARYGLYALSLGGLFGYAISGTLRWGVVLCVFGVIGLVEALVRRKPAVAPVVAMTQFILVVTLATFVLQGDFGPLMVTTPAILVTTWVWALTRSSEQRPTVAGGASSQSAGSPARIGAAAVLTVCTSMATGVCALIAWDLRSLTPDFARASERFMIWWEPWFARSADWTVRGLWIATGAFGENTVAWVANLHSDLAWIAAVQTQSLWFGVGIILLFAMISVSLLVLALETLRRSEVAGTLRGGVREGWRRASLLTTFVSVYLLFEVLVHLASGFAWIPPTGLTLPWISNGGSAAFSFAVLVGCAIGSCASALDLRGGSHRTEDP